MIDIGANIGIFAVYAALKGASKVYAYEPCEESFKLLQENISSNNLTSKIVAIQAVIAGLGSEPIPFPRASNVFNSRTLRDTATANTTLVPVVTLEDVELLVSSPSILKIDCEGGEYDIILNSQNSAFNQILEIRLEYHTGPQEQLFQRFREMGYLCQKHIHEGPGGGYLWLKKIPN